MREILFRGKRNRDWKNHKIGQWVMGCLWHHTNEGSIIYSDELDDKVWVFPETVGQFTGLTDKNGKKIFEGDLFQMDEDDIAVVIFKDGCFRLEVHGLCGEWTESGFDECGGGHGIIDCDPIDWYYVGDMEIIGNIHDNPELLEDNEK